MKKSFKIVGIAAMMMILLASCKKCYECTKNTSFGRTDETVCDYPGEAHQRAENLERDGYFCTAKN